MVEELVLHKKRTRRTRVGFSAYFYCRSCHRNCLYTSRLLHRELPDCLCTWLHCDKDQSPPCMDRWWRCNFFLRNLHDL